MTNHVICEATVPQLLTAAKVAASYVQRREDVAVITLGEDTEVFVGVDYWLNSATGRRFEQAAAAKALARGLRSAIMVLPLVTTTESSGMHFRPLGDGDTEADETALLWFFVCHVDTGFDLARSVLRWSDDGTASFDALEILQGPSQLIPDSPGFALMQAMLAAPTKEHV